MICRAPFQVVKFFKVTNISVSLKITAMLACPIIKWIVKGPISSALDINLDINGTCCYRKDSVHRRMPVAVPALVSQRNHRLGISFAPVFRSCRSPTWPVTITHCLYSRLAGCCKESALGIEGWAGRIPSGCTSSFSCSLGGKLQSDHPRTSEFSLESPLE